MKRPENSSIPPPDGGSFDIPENAAQRHRHGQAWRSLDGNEVEGLTTSEPRWLLWTLAALLVFWTAVALVIRWLWM